MYKIYFDVVYVKCINIVWMGFDFFICVGEGKLLGVGVGGEDDEDEFFVC